MADTASRILTRWEQLDTLQQPCRSVWQDIADFVIPYKSNILVKRLEGTKQTERLFDATAPHALVLLASSMHQSMTPSTQPWLSLRMRQAYLNDVKEVEDWLEDCARRMHAAFRQSTFNQSIHEMYLDIAAFGTGALFIEAKGPSARGQFGGFRFYVPAVGDYVIAENADGQVDTLFRSFTLSLRAADGKWPGKLSQDSREKLKAKPDEMIQILHAVYPRRDLKYGEDGKRRAGGKNMPWTSCYVEVAKKHKIDEGGFEELPVVVARWAKTSGEVYGRGPSHTALPDVASLNAAKEFILKSAPIAMWPPTLEREDAVIGDPNLEPHGRNVVSGAGPVGEQLQFMDPKVRVDMHQIILTELRQAIHAIYFTDQLILHEKPQMTATEVIALQEQMQRLLGPTTGRLESEFLNPLVQRAFAIMARAGAFLPLPQALRELVAEDQADLDIEYEGPLARAQRTIELGAQDRVVQWVIGVTQAKAATPGAPEWDLLDTDQMVRDRAEITGLRSDSLISQERVEEIRAQRAAEQKALADRNAAAQAAEMAGKAAPFITATQQAQNGGPGKVAA